MSPSTNHASIKDAIDNLYADDGTNLNTSLTQAILVHDAITRPVDEPSSKAILFLTDGDPDFYGDYTPCGSPGSPASTAASMGLTIYAIGHGSDAVEAPLIDMVTCTKVHPISVLTLLSFKRFSIQFMRRLHCQLVSTFMTNICTFITPNKLR